MSDFSPTSDHGIDRSGLEPELGGILRDAPLRSGFEPELGGALRQKSTYVDETTCIGCKHCAHTAPNTFYLEPNHGRARVFNQNGDTEDLIDEAIDTCPVNCIYQVDYTKLKQLEEERKYQVIKNLGFPQITKKLSKKKQKKANS